MITRVLNLLRRKKQRLVVELRPVHYKVIRDIEYLASPSGERADLYLPRIPAGSLRAAIVVIHGGGWVEGDKANPREVSICNDLANHGFVVLSINYTLFKKDDPVPVWPTNLHDGKTAVRWLRMNAATYQIDADHIGVLGESSGGQLAALVALTGPEDGLDPAGPYAEFSCRVQAAVDLYGPVDFRQREKLMPMLGKLPAEAPELYAQASPAAYGDRTSPPMMLIHGTADDCVPVGESEILDAALTAAGAPYELILLPGGGHAFDLRPKEMDLRPVVFDFFDKHLGRAIHALFALAWVFCASNVRADDVGKLVDLGTYFQDSKGELIVQLTGDRSVWQNGRPIIFQPFPDCAMACEAFAKPGDTLVVADSDSFIRYRLDRLSTREAAFMVWRYAMETTRTHRLRCGKLLSMERATVDLPLEITNDSQPNLVEVGHVPARRTK